MILDRRCSVAGNFFGNTESLIIFYIYILFLLVTKENKEIERRGR